MIILGDIGNTETKICLVKNDKIIKKILIPSLGKKNHILAHDSSFFKYEYASSDDFNLTT